MKFFINIIFYYCVTFVSIFVVPKDVDIELQHGNVLNCNPTPNLSSASVWWLSVQTAGVELFLTLAQHSTCQADCFLHI